MQVIPAQAGVGGLGGALVLALHRALVTPSAPPDLLSAVPSWQPSGCSLLHAIAEWTSSNFTSLALVVGAALLLLALLLGFTVGVLVGSVARCAIGRHPAPIRLVPGAQRVAAHRD